MDNLYFFNFTKIKKDLEGKTITKVESFDEDRGFHFYFLDGTYLPIRGGTLGCKHEEDFIPVVALDGIFPILDQYYEVQP